MICLCVKPLCVEISRIAGSARIVHHPHVRIIAGKAGRIAIRVPSSVTRPTTDFVRQAVFSILAGQVDGARALDLFAGSGALGLEALSRGAASCVFVEKQRQAASVISKNLEKSKLTGGRVITSAVGAFLGRDTGQYDLIFADPPYWKHAGDADEIANLLDGPALQARLARDGWFIAEASSAYRPPQAPEFELIDRRTYGSSAVLLYRAATGD